METLDSGQNTDPNPNPGVFAPSSNGARVSFDPSLDGRVEGSDESVSGTRNNGVRVSGGEAVNRVVGTGKGDKDGVGLFNGEALTGKRVESEVLVERNGEDGSGSGKGAFFISGVGDTVVGSSVIDLRLKVDGPSASVVQDKAEEIAGAGGLEMESVNFPSEKVQKLGFGDSVVSAGDGAGKTAEEVIEKTVAGGEILPPETDRVEEIAVREVSSPLVDVDEKQNANFNPTDAHIALMGTEDKLVSSKEVSTSLDGEHVGEKDNFFERSHFGEENLSLGAQGNELFVAGVEGVELEGQEEGETDARKSRFKVGDFVWCRVKGHPWWPGQIYDHSDASEYAAKHCRKNCLLVVYFGNKSFAWSYPSQLRPFTESFQLMSPQSNAKTFRTAVEAALDELGRCVKSEMICSCVPVEARASLVRPATVNAGIKEEVIGPEGCIGELSVAGFDPASFLTQLRGAALAVGAVDMLELAVFIRRMSAFRWVKGYGRFPMPQGISEVSDSKNSAENQILENNKFDDQRAGHTQDPDEEEGVSSPMSPSVCKSGTILSKRSAGDRHQRKKRSMAELLQENMEPELENDSANVTEEGKLTDKLHLSTEKKIEHIGSPSRMMDNEDKNDNDPAKDGMSAPLKRRKRTKNLASPSMLKIDTSTNKDDDVGQGGAILTSPRIRKKSKYLSPPYTMLGGLDGMSSLKDIKTGTSKSPRVSQVVGSFSGKDDETETSKATYVAENGEALSGIEGQSIVSPLIQRCSDEISRKKISESVHGEHKASGSSSPQTAEYNQNTTALKEFDASADKMLSEYLAAALDPLYLKGKRSSNAVKGFFTKYRSSRYLEGPSFDIYNKHVADFSGTESKSSKAAHGLSENVSRGAGANEDKYGPDDSKRISMPAVPSSMRNSNEANQSVSKSGSGDRKKKSQSMKHVSMGKYSQAEQSVPTFGLCVAEKGSLPEEHFSLENYSNQADLSVPKSVSVGKKRKTLSNMHVSPGKDSSAADQSQGKTEQKTKKRKKEGSFAKTSNKSGQSVLEKMGPVEWGAGNSSVEVNQKEANGEKPVALFLTYAPGFPLPSKEDLIKNFSNFGVLIESETVLLRESGCARVVFARSSDAEAFYNSDKKNALGPFIVNCQLQYPSPVPRGFELNSSFQMPPMTLGGTITPSPPSKSVNGPPLHVIRQNLEVMMSMLSESAEKESSVDKLSPEVQANLTGEIKGLLKKVTTMMNSSS